MSKGKRGKSGLSSDVVRKDTELAQVPFCENDWNAMVVFVSPNTLTDDDVVEILTESVKSGIRKLFSIINYKQLLAEIKEMVPQKPAKGKGAAVANTPQFSEICDQVKALLNQGETIPVSLLAKLIKFKMLAIKAKDVARRELLKNLKTKLEGNQAKATSPARAKSKSPAKGGKKGAKKEDIKPPPKKETKMKKRGEDSGPITIDDEPDGLSDPQHYILLTGFVDAALLSCLVNVKVLPNAVIRLTTDYHLKMAEVETESIGSSEEISEEMIEEGRILQLEREEFGRNLKTYWENSDLLMKHAPTAHPLQNVAKFNINVEKNYLPDEMLDVISEEIKNDFGAWLFEKVADVCYDLLDYLRHYNVYMDDLKIVDVSVPPKNILPPNTAGSQNSELSGANASVINCGNIDKLNGDQAPAVELCYYDKLLSNVAVDSESVPLILHCLLEQVTAITDGPNPMDVPLESRDDGFDHLIGEYLDKQLAIYGLSDSKRIWKCEVNKPLSPKIVYHGDEMRCRLLNMCKTKEFDAHAIEERMFQMHPCTRLMQHLQPTEEELVENCMRRAQLFNFCKSSQRASTSEEKFERAMRQYIFEVLPLEIVATDDGTVAGEKKEGELEEQLENVVGRWDDPYYDRRRRSSSNQQQRHARRSVSGEKCNDTSTVQQLDHYNWLERLEPSVLYQVLDKSSDLRPCMDTYYNRGNNTVLVIQYNPCSDETLQNNFAWDSWLHSDVGFRNFLEHVFVEVQDWSMEQDVLLQEDCNEKQKSPQESRSSSPAPHPPKDRSRWGMKTRAELAEEKEKSKDEKAKKGSGRASSKKKSAEKKKTSAQESKLKKMSAKKTPHGSASKRPTSPSGKSIVSFTDSSAVEPPAKQYAFTGYNVGDNLLHVRIDHSYMFPRNGALIKVDNTSYTNQDQCVQVTLMFKGDAFTVNFLNPLPIGQEIDGHDEEPIERVESSDVGTNASQQKDLSPQFTEAIVELPKLPKQRPVICSYSSITGKFSDGMIAVFSSASQQEKSSEVTKVNEILASVSKETAEVANLPTNTTAPKSPKGKRGKKEEEARFLEEQERLQREADNAKKLIDRQREITRILKEQATAHNLYLTCPNGVHLSFKHGLFVDDFEKLDSPTKTLFLKQQQFSNYREKVTLENHDVVKELYRCVTECGMVMKFNSDDTVEILSPHGDIFHSSPYTTQPRAQSPVKNDMVLEQVNSSVRSSSRKSKQAKAQATVDPVTEQQPIAEENSEGVEWHVLSGDGEKWLINKDKSKEDFDAMLISDAKCFDTNQILRTREDGVLIIFRPDGSKIVEYPDGTRISTHEESCTEDFIDKETGEFDGTKTTTRCFVTIEHHTYPTTVVDLSECSMQVHFSNGKNVQAFKNGSYVISNEKSKQMVISSSGEAEIYPGEKWGSSCVMKESIKNCFNLVDDFGNTFNVDANGDCTTVKSSNHQEPVSAISPRYFVVYADGSGEELLRYEDVCEYLHDAEEKTRSALVHAAVEGDEEATAVTVIKPYKGQIWEPKKREENIIPVSLRERDFKTLPLKEERKPGPRFGTRLTCDTKAKPNTKPSYPSVLEIRHLINYEGLNDDIRHDIVDSINKYGSYVQKQKEEMDRVKGYDERTVEERYAAEKIKNKFVQKKDKDPVRQFVTETANEAAKEILTEQYIDAITPSSPPSPRRAKPERPASAWEHDKKELEELEHAKAVIRNKEFPPYFKQGEGFLYESGVLPNMAEFTNRLSEETKHPGELGSSLCSLQSQQSGESAQITPAGQSTPHVQDSSFSMQMSSSLSIKYDTSSNASISPYISAIDTNSSFGIGRPLNPTPQKACNDTASVEDTNNNKKKLNKILELESSYEDPSIYSENVFQDILENKSALYDVTGLPRKQAVETPVSILGSRPNALPNEKFSIIEEPVRRQVKTSSVFGSMNSHATSKLRGFILFPDLVDFGVLREGFSYTYPVLLKNVGVDTCRFKIKQPPPSTGIKILYQPGPVAAGMEMKIDVEVFAVAVGVEGNNGVGKIAHHVEVTTETDILYLPVVATVITQHEFENPSEHTPSGGPSTGTYALTNRPSSRETLTRPRKET